MAALDNANPLIFNKSKAREIIAEEEDDNISDEIDSREIFGNNILLLLYNHCNYVVDRFVEEFE